LVMPWCYTRAGIGVAITQSQKMSPDLLKVWREVGMAVDNASYTGALLAPIAARIAAGPE